MPAGPRDVPRNAPSSKEEVGSGTSGLGTLGSTAPDTLGGWVAGRPSPVPGEFLEHLNVTLPFETRALVADAEQGLEASLGDPSEEPHARAFDLLRADALVTYACQRIVQENERPDEALRLLALRLSRGR